MSVEDCKPIQYNAQRTKLIDVIKAKVAPKYQKLFDNCKQAIISKLELNCQNNTHIEYVVGENYEVALKLRDWLIREGFTVEYELVNDVYRLTISGW